jgi:hypothetical protein
MAEVFVLERFFIRLLVRGVLGVLLLVVVAYPLDWAVWRVRVAAGGGMGSVQVDRFTVAELKGGKEDYYPDGTEIVACSRSLYPQGGNGACWWVERHREVLERY